MLRKQTDLISVIIPVYNSENTVTRCIEAVCAQTYKNLEIIVVYKPGSDNSLKKIKKIKDSRIKIIEQITNTGPGGARNIGIDNANGNYLGFVEADDYIAPDFYEKLINAAKQSQCDIALGSITTYKNVKSGVVYSNYSDKLRILQNGASFDKLYKTSLIKSHNIRFLENVRWEDNLFVLKALYYGDMVTVKDAYYSYEFSGWSDEYKQKLKNDVLPVCREILKFAKSEKISCFDKWLIQQKIVDWIAISFIDDEHIYQELMNLMGNPLFLWIKHLKIILKQQHNKKRTKND